MKQNYIPRVGVTKTSFIIFYPYGIYLNDIDATVALRRFKSHL